MPLTSLRTLSVAAVLALAAATAVWLNPWAAPDGPLLADVLAGVAGHDSARLEVVSGDDRFDAVTAGRGEGYRRRIDTGRGLYALQRGGTRWIVDAQSQDVSVSRVAPPGDDARVSELFDLLGASDTEAAAWRARAAVPPSGRTVGAGPTFYTYLVAADQPDVRPLTVRTSEAGDLELSVPAAAGQPATRVQVVRFDVALQDEEFAVPDTFTADGRVGKVLDVQGVVAVKPRLQTRWTPLVGETVLKPGDLVRADVRGANAARLRLTSGVEFILGPGSQLQLPTADKPKLVSGTAEVTGAVELLGPGDSRMAVEEQDLNAEDAEDAEDAERAAEEGRRGVVLRVEEGKLVRVGKEPLWLAGFKGTTATDPLGSLVVNVDGRNVPLTIGYHKVSVDIRDQIARTTIEETFKNNTDTRTEGVFYFPLPQGASISGFAMWIGNEQVEADVVEKQRAREIYETILREKRDPGLLEWAGGSLFKARVFPIEANSEKRVKITYTQVLPQRGNQYRYGYNLQSEMLKKHPLRELIIDVKISSAVPLAGVTCPTHEARINQTKTAAQVEFAAQEYTPTSGFEVVVEKAQEAENVVVVPHRRGDDGYFMLQLAVPDEGPPGERDTIPDGAPLDLLVLADTSASMTADQRETQARFVTALAGSLGTGDQFRLMAVDVDLVPLRDGPVKPDAPNDEAALDRLAARESLGWTDLHRAFAGILGRVRPGTQVIYVGDGMVTAAGDDPASFVQYLQALEEDTKASFHAVGTGATIEPLVMRAIAGVGGGSYRQVEEGRTPVAVALELLTELSKPALKDIAVSFEGVRTARVYPPELPNLPVGTQQIVLGRYLPTDQKQTGKVVVTGSRGGKEVRIEQDFTLPAGDAGNSFLPRLWARSYLDELMTEVNSEEVKGEIIGLSEEFNILTPFTSLLVLESDADRERFGVTKRFRMRDGEKFFAEGRVDVKQQMRQQHLQQAREWRENLREQVLTYLDTLGRRVLPMPGVEVAPIDPPIKLAAFGDVAEQAAGEVGGFGGGGGEQGEFLMRDGAVDSRGRGLTRNFNGRLSESLPEPSDAPVPMAAAPQAPQAPQAPGSTEGFADSESLGMEMADSDADFAAPSLPAEPSLAEPMGEIAERRKSLPQQLSDRLSGKREQVLEEKLSQVPGRVSRPAQRQPLAGAEVQLRAESDSVQYDTNEFFARSDMGRRPYGYGRGGIIVGEPLQRTGGPSWLQFGVRPWNPAGPPAEPAPLDETAELDAAQWLGQYAGWITRPLPTAPAVPTLGETADWPADVKAVADSLLRTQALGRIDGGLVVRRVQESFDARWNEVRSRHETVSGWSPVRWYHRSQGETSGGVATRLDACDGDSRLTLDLAVGGGWSRPTQGLDRERPQFQSGGHTFVPLAETYSGYSAKLVPTDAEDRVKLVLTGPERVVQVTRANDGRNWVETLDQTLRIELTVDTARDVVVENAQSRGDKPWARTVYSDFVQVAGLWWPGTQTDYNGDGQRTAVVTYTHEQLAADEFGARYAKELSARDGCVVLPTKLPGFAAAAAAGDDDVSVPVLLTRLVMLGYRNQADRQPAAFEKLVAAVGENMRLVPWWRLHDRQSERRNEEARVIALSLAAELAGREKAEGRSDDLHLANLLFGAVDDFASQGEQKRVLDELKPVFDRQPPFVQAFQSWGTRYADRLQRLDLIDREMDLRKELAQTYPRELSLQTTYADRWWQIGYRERAYEWIARTLAGQVPWNPSERDGLHAKYLSYLETEYRYDEVVAYVRQWIEEGPEQTLPYQALLGALLMTDQLATAEGLVDQWLAVGREPVAEDTAAGRKFQAAFEFALGSRRYGNSGGIDERWLPTVTDLAQLWLETDRLHRWFEQVVTNDQFRATEPARELLATLRDKLLAEAGTADLERIQRLLAWVEGDDSVFTADHRQTLARTLIARWAEMRPKPDDGEAVRTQVAWGDFIVQVMMPLDVEARLAFLRRRIEEGPESNRPIAATALFETLLSLPWQEAYEDEAYALAGTMIGDDTPEQGKLSRRILLAMRWTSAMIAKRVTAATEAIENYDELTRTEKQQKSDAILKDARTALAAKLAAHAADAEGDLADWLRAEELDLLVRIGDDLPASAERVWQSLPEQPPELMPSAETLTDDNRDELVAAERQRLLTVRRLITAAYFAAKHAEATGGPERLVAYAAAASERHSESPAWMEFRVSLLLALDRPQDLETLLTARLETDPQRQWRYVLAMVQAELGKLAAAAASFERIAAESKLGAEDYQRLADWYLVLDRKDQSAAAKRESWRVMDEGRLTGKIQELLRKVYPQGDQPGEDLDEDVPEMFAVLLQKSQRPADHLGTLANAYAQTKDFRLLAGLAESIVGQTAGSVYPFLQGMSRVTQQIQDEATVDRIAEQMTGLRDRELTPVDARALHLLEMLVHRRAAELINQPGPHGEKAVAALKAATTDQQWEEGEKKLMADLLAGFGKIGYAPLAAVQLDVLGRFYRQADVNDPRELLHLASRYAGTLAQYGKRNQAVTVYEETFPHLRDDAETLPQYADGAVVQYVSLMQGLGRWTAAEQFLREERDKVAGSDRRTWWTDRLYDLIASALHKPEVRLSLGAGNDLFVAYEKLLRAAITGAPFGRRQAVLGKLLGAYRIAHQKQYGFRERLTAFAFEESPTWLERQIPNHAQVVGQVADVLHDLLGDRAALRYVVERIEQQPKAGGLRQPDHLAEPGGQPGPLAPRRRRQAGRGAGRPPGATAAGDRAGPPASRPGRPAELGPFLHRLGQPLRLEGEGRRLRPRRRGGVPGQDEVRAGGGVPGGLPVRGFAPLRPGHRGHEDGPRRRPARHRRRAGAGAVPPAPRPPRRGPSSGSSSASGRCPSSPPHLLGQRQVQHPRPRRLEVPGQPVERRPPRHIIRRPPADVQQQGRSTLRRECGGERGVWAAAAQDDGVGHAGFIGLVHPRAVPAGMIRQLRSHAATRRRSNPDLRRVAAWL